MVLGIIGAGELAQLLAQASASLGIKTLCLAKHFDDCAGIASHLYVPDPDDPDTLAAFVRQVDVVTCEHPFIPLDVYDLLSHDKPLYPSLEALSATQDRLYQKIALTELHIPTARFCSVTSLDELMAGLRDIGYPATLTSRRPNQAGKLTHVIHNEVDAKAAWHALSHSTVILEAFHAHTKRLTLTAVRNGRGDRVYYPLTENNYQESRLLTSSAPVLNEHWQEEAMLYAKVLMDRWNHVGTLTIEWLVTNDNQLLANDITPCVHRSGMWTIEGAFTSQFENHVRAIFNLPLGKTDTPFPTTTQYLTGQSPMLSELLMIPHAHIHRYGKVAKPGRAMGHITTVALPTNENTTQRRAIRASQENVVEEAIASKQCTG